MMKELLSAAALAVFVTAVFCFMNFHHRTKEDNRHFSRVSLVMLILSLVGIAGTAGSSFVKDWTKPQPITLSPENAIICHPNVPDDMKIMAFMLLFLLMLIGVDYFLTKLLQRLLKKIPGTARVLVAIVVCIAADVQILQLMGGFLAKSMNTLC